MMSGKKILFINSSSGYFIQHHLPLAIAAGRDMEVHAALAVDSEEDAERLAAAGVILHRIPLSRKSVNPLRLASEIMALRRIIRRIQPDIVNPITLKCVLAGALSMAHLPSPAFVGTITGLGYLFAGDSPKQRLLRETATVALRQILPGIRHLLVFSNVDDRDEFLSRGITVAARTRVIPVPGVDVRRFGFAPEPAAGFRVAMPARMLRDKGVGEFVAAATLLRQRDPGIRCVLAGDVDPGNPASLDAKRLGDWADSGVVDWLGRLDDMPALLSSCHAVCLPSYREGFPMALAEAMSCGRAVVTTDVPGCRDAVAGHGTGLLVPPRDSEALAEALLRLRNEPELRRGMGEKGRRLVEDRLSRERISGMMMDVYNRQTGGERRFKPYFLPGRTQPAFPPRLAAGRSGSSGAPGGAGGELAT